MEYSSEYYEKYKAIMNPKENWVKYMQKRYQVIWKHFLWIMLGILLIPTIIGSVLIGVDWLGIYICIELVILYKFMLWFEKVLIKERQGIANKIYKVSSWDEVYEFNRSRFIGFLRAKNITTSKQVECLIKDIDRYEREIQRDFIGGGVVVVFLVPLWSEYVKAQSGIMGGVEGIRFLLFWTMIILLLWAGIVAFLKGKNGFKESKHIQLKQMKRVLLEVYIELIGWELE